jgi:acyl-coenzyme A synthetase/AMP-(fatty) acid ligase
VGVALDGGQLTILTEDGHSARPGESGHVIYSGQNVMMGYASCRSDLSHGDEQQGRLETGDLGYLDEDGYLFLTGRSKRISKIFGLRISLDEIEARLVEAGPCAALDAQERILIFHEAGASDIRARLSALAEALGLPSVAFAARLVDSLPRKASGKLDYGALKELV